MIVDYYEWILDLIRHCYCLSDYIYMKPIYNHLPVIFLLATAIHSVEEGATKISQTRNSLRTSVCEYYSANFTNTER